MDLRTSLILWILCSAKIEFKKKIKAAEKEIQLLSKEKNHKFENILDD